MTMFDLFHHEGEDGADVGVAVDEVGRPIWMWYFWPFFSWSKFTIENMIRQVVLDFYVGENLLGR